VRTFLSVACLRAAARSAAHALRNCCSLAWRKVWAFGDMQRSYLPPLAKIKAAFRISVAVRSRRLWSAGAVKAKRHPIAFPKTCFQPVSVIAGHFARRASSIVSNSISQWASGKDFSAELCSPGLFFAAGMMSTVSGTMARGPCIPN
jgi:hypothetical protein